MYGMIHAGIKQMVLDLKGEDAWAAIESEAGSSPLDTIPAMVYDDELTIRLLTVASQHLNLSVSQGLQAFGRYWIRFAERGSFSALLNFTGSDIASFIANLDRMHQAVVAALPDARVPSFEIVRQDHGWLQVAYRSDREGLGLFVLGLFEGLLDRFELDGSVRQVASTTNAAEFEIIYRAD